VQLLFLDVNLGGMSGLELLETSAVAGQVILTTAHPQHAQRAYDLKVADYLLKPFSFARFVQAVDEAQQRLARSAAPARDHFFIKTELRLERVRFDDLVYIEGDSDYRCIHTRLKDIMTLATFGELEQRIPREVACRVHKSYMVALDKIESIERDRITIGDAEIPISASYRERFYLLIDHRGK
jgi:two-component system, LytTR family, response regulator